MLRLLLLFLAAGGLAPGRRRDLQSRRRRRLASSASSTSTAPISDHGGGGGVHRGCGSAGRPIHSSAQPPGGASGSSAINNSRSAGDGWEVGRMRPIMRSPPALTSRRLPRRATAAGHASTRRARARLAPLVADGQLCCSRCLELIPRRALGSGPCREKAAFGRGPSTLETGRRARTGCGGCSRPWRAAATTALRDSGSAGTARSRVVSAPPSHRQ
jgi:hypothetical protein